MRGRPPSAFLSIGFRPFYLGAAVFAALSIPLWVAAYIGPVTITAAYAGFAWHTHEMLFGFAPAIIAGFLLTAVRNWTGLPTASGPLLGSLFVVWLCGRFAPFIAPAPIAALADLAFLPALMLCIAVPLWRSRNRRNGFVVAVLLILWLCNAAFHGVQLQVLPPAFLAAALATARDLILLLMIVIGGRVIPAFSRNAIRGLEPRSWPWLERLSIGGVVVIATLDAAGPWLSDGRYAWNGLYSALAYLVAGLHLLRLAGWQPWRTRGNLLLVMLPVSYAWIPIHLALRGWLEAAPGSLHPVAEHALFVGAMAGLMFSMMTRSALGHTGHALRAGWVEATGFALLQIAAVARTAGPLAGPEVYRGALVVSAAVWSVAFALFAAAYAPLLLKPRPDTQSAPGS
ncbi:MAG: NnrS family protein [Pseudomonadales bacterium]